MLSLFLLIGQCFTLDFLKLSVLSSLKSLSILRVLMFDMFLYKLYLIKISPVFIYIASYTVSGFNLRINGDVWLFKAVLVEYKILYIK